MLYAYFGGLGADKQSTYELLLEQHENVYRLTAVFAAHGMPDEHQPPVRWHWLRPPSGGAETRRLYAGTELRRALLILLQSACAANLAELGQRYCYVLPSALSQPGALAVLARPQLRYDSTLPVHPQLWQAGRALDTLPIGRQRHVCREPYGHSLEPVAEGRASRRPLPSRLGR